MPRKTPKRAAEQIETDQRRRECLELRTRGLSMAAIGEKLGLAKSTVHKHVRKALDDLAEKDSETTARYRALNLQRLESVMAALWVHATGGVVQTKRRTHRDGSVTETTMNVLDVKAAREVRQLITAMNKLLGLEAPIKIAHTDPTGDQERSPHDWYMPLPADMDPQEWAASMQKMMANRTEKAEALVAELLGKASEQPTGE